MSMHWFVRVHGGASFFRDLGSAAGAPGSRQINGGASLGYRMRSHTFIGSFEQNSYDSSTSVVGSNRRVSAAWNWRDPRRSWGLHAAFTRSDLSNTGFVNIGGWHASASFVKRLGWNLMTTATYTHLWSRGAFLNTRNLIVIDTVRVSIGWTPRLRREISDGPALEP
jgi:hypothetical protein